MEATQTVKTDRELDFMYTGFVLIKKFHILLVVLFMVIQIAVQAALGVYYFYKFNNTLTNHEGRISSIESTQSMNLILLQELQFNMQTQMEKDGLTYKQFKMPEVKK